MNLTPSLPRAWGLSGSPQVHKKFTSEPFPFAPSYTSHGRTDIWRTADRRPVCFSYNAPGQIFRYYHRRGSDESNRHITPRKINYICPIKLSCPSHWAITDSVNQSAVNHQFSLAEQSAELRPHVLAECILFPLLGALRLKTHTR